jgi:hypothetical protein
MTSRTSTTAKTIPLVSTMTAWRWLLDYLEEPSSSGHLRIFVMKETQKVLALLDRYMASDPSAYLKMPIIASKALFTVAVESGASFHVLRDLQLGFLDGRLHASHHHRGPLDLEHAAACRKGLRDLALAGVFTDGGQERYHSLYHVQRAYLSGSFILKWPGDVEDVRAIMDATGCCYRAIVESPTHTLTLQRLLGVDARRADATATTFDVAQNKEDDDPIWVTLSDGYGNGHGFTCVHVERDAYKLKGLRQGPVASFMLWDPSWWQEEDGTLLEPKLLASLSARSHVVHSVDT